MIIKKLDAQFALLVAALLAGSAAYWFISGETAAHSFLRNLAVFLQLLLGLGLAVFALFKKNMNRSSGIHSMKGRKP